MPRVGFEPVIPAIKRLQTYSLDRTATEISLLPQCGLWNIVTNLNPRQWIVPIEHHYIMIPQADKPLEMQEWYGPTSSEILQLQAKTKVVINNHIEYDEMRGKKR
jgi:hypothetical protein